MNDVIKSINVDGIEYDIQAKELTKVTYAELKELRDNGGLVAGHLYRITDYEFTTKQVETKSAGHVFDIIVLAVAENELSHIARAIAHEGDTYFDGNDLGAWELWYELDNDAEKYAWADAENGKGIIYRMIDEKRNDCPYDFKNALFYNEKLTTGTTSDKYYYTFSYVVKGVLYDGTVEKQVTNCYGNSMGVTWTLLGKKEMNKNVFRNMAFSYYCRYNTFGSNCELNTFGSNCELNTFGNTCTHNTFGRDCRNNTFGNYCRNNTFGDYCHSNTFGESCNNNKFGESCNNNKFGYSCGFNTFGSYCQNNTFWGNCEYNTLEGDCHINIFGNGVSHRTLNSKKTSITLNDEYFDDGSGKLVPVKHPDLSTQPSILPYKFMGQYVYEQLIPHDGSDRHKYNTWFPLQDLAVQNPMFLEAQCIMSDGVCSCDIKVQGLELEAVSNEQREGIKFVRVVYTSMPDDGGYYYEYGGGDSLSHGLYVEIHSIGQQVNVNKVLASDVQLEMTGAMSYFAPPWVLPSEEYIQLRVYDIDNTDVTDKASNVTIESEYNVSVGGMLPTIFIANYDQVLFSKIDRPVVVHIYF